MASITQSTNKNIRKLWLCFWMYSIGVFFIYSAFGTLLSLQSSINVVDGLGTFTLAIVYVTAVLFTPLCVPILLRKFGAKKCICGSEITYVIYTAANMYPKFYTMVPASILVGMGDCILWSCMPLLNSFFAQQYSDLSTKRSNTNRESKFSGYFFAVFQTAKIVGSLISYTVLYGFNTKEDLNTTSLNFSDINSTFFENQKLNYCGANDCQDDSIVTETIDQYVPASKVAIYVLMSIMGLLCISAIVLHVVFIPDDQKYELKLNVQVHKTKNIPVCVNEAFDVTVEKIETENASKDEKNSDEMEDLKLQPGYCKFSLRTLRDVGSQLIDIKQLLLTPMIIYIGLDYGFITSDLTRSYSSCVFGVEWVSLHLIAYGIGGCLVSYLVGKLSKRISRNVFFAVSTIVDGGMYLYCVFWDAHRSTHYSVIPIYLLLGGMQGIWISLTQIVQMDYFSDRLDVASPAWNLWFMFGIGLQYAWSTSLCVRTKIHIQLGMLLLGVSGYATAEYLHRKPKSELTITNGIKTNGASEHQENSKEENYA